MNNGKPTKASDAITSDAVRESINSHLSEITKKFSNLFPENIKDILKYGDILTTNYSHQSKEMIEKILLSDEQYPTDKAKFLKLVELYDKMISLVLKTVDGIEEIANKFISLTKEKITLSDRLQLLLYKRELDGLLTEINYIIELLDEYSFKIGKKNIKELDFEKMQFENSIEQAIRILDELEDNGMQPELQMRNMKPHEKAIFNYANSKRGKRIHVVKNNVAMPNTQ